MVEYLKRLSPLFTYGRFSSFDHLMKKNSIEPFPTPVADAVAHCSIQSSIINGYFTTTFKSKK